MSKKRAWVQAVSRAGEAPALSRRGEGVLGQTQLRGPPRPVQQVPQRV